jgi:polar amino acid transport system substrate-binding protein
MTGRSARDLDLARGRKVGTLPGSLAERILEARRRRGEDLRRRAERHLRRSEASAAPTQCSSTIPSPAITAPSILPSRSCPGPSARSSTPSPSRRDDRALLEAVNQALDEPRALTARSRLIYARWGLWTEETGKLPGIAAPAAGAMSEAYDAWRAANGKRLPFWTRVKERYPGTLLLFGKGAVITLSVSLASMALADRPGRAHRGRARAMGPWPIRWLCRGVHRGLPRHAAADAAHHGLFRPPRAGPHPSALRGGLAGARAQLRRGRGRELPRRPLQRPGVGSSTRRGRSGSARCQALRFVVGPQAVRMAIPPATNDFIALLKDSSLVSVVTLTELTKTYVNLASSMRDHLGLGALVASDLPALEPAVRAPRPLGRGAARADTCAGPREGEGEHELRVIGSSSSNPGSAAPALSGLSLEVCGAGRGGARPQRLGQDDLLRCVVGLDPFDVRHDRGRRRHLHGRQDVSVACELELR